jgi:hypothetical protein
MPVVLALPVGAVDVGTIGRGTVGSNVLLWHSAASRTEAADTGVDRCRWPHMVCRALCGRSGIERHPVPPRMKSQSMP